MGLGTKRKKKLMNWRGEVSEHVGVRKTEKRKERENEKTIWVQRIEQSIPLDLGRGTYPPRVLHSAHANHSEKRNSPGVGRQRCMFKLPFLLLRGFRGNGG